MDAQSLKLRAEDEEDLRIISACLQDALVSLADMEWLADEQRFVAVVNRFCWERPAETMPAEEDGDGEAIFWSRTHGLLNLCRVEAVRMQGVEAGNRTRIYSILRLVPHDQGVDLEFAGGGAIRLQSSAIDVYLEDLGEPWPTKWRPDHQVNENQMTE